MTGIIVVGRCDLRTFFAALFLCLCAPLTAQASWMIPQATPEKHVAHARGHQYVRVHNHETGSARSVLNAGNRIRFAACARYGSLQCGCTASMIVFGRILPGLPAVGQWMARFERTSPHVGAAAIWPEQHVEIVSAVNGDGTVDTKGSVGWRHVSVARLIFVEPHTFALRPKYYRYARL